MQREHVESLGIRTMPVYGIRENGKCDCGASACKRPGKHAKLWDGATAKEGDGFACLTGERSGIFVVDLDKRENKDGWAEFQKLGDVPETFTVLTPTGGRHLYFKHPGFPIKNSISAIAPGVDIKGDGIAFVVGPGSSHKSGGTYQIYNDAPISEAPQWLLDHPEIKKYSRKVSPPSPVDLPPHLLERNTKAFRELCNIYPPAVEGEGGSVKLFNLAQKGVRHFALPSDTVLTILLSEYNPRCVPPWEESDIRHKVDDAFEKSDMAYNTYQPEVLSAISEATRPPKPVGTGRKLYDPDHVYTFDPCRDAPTTDDLSLIPSHNTAVHWLTGGVWEGVLQYDAFADRILAVNPPLKMDLETEGLSDTDINNVRLWFECRGYKISPRDVQAAIWTVAKANSFHPVREYLASLPPSDTSILDKLATTLFGARTQAENMLLRKFLISAVRRILQPGCQADTMLVLYGAKQGEGKTSFVRILFGDWTLHQLPGFQGRDASHALHGKWGIEVAELDAMLRSETNTTKEFLSRTVDEYRQFGNGQKVIKPRQCVFVGTTNIDDFLRDSTGNRRFAPIEVTCSVPLEWLAANRDAIWSAAHQAALSKEPHWLSEPEAEQLREIQQQYIQDDMWEEVVKDYCCGKDTVTVKEIYLNRIAKGDANATSKMNKSAQIRICDSLRRLGCKSSRSAEHRYWKIPPRLKQSIPSDTEQRIRFQESSELATNVN